MISEGSIFNIAVVVNPNAGSGRSLLLAEKINAELDLRSLRFTCFERDWPENFSGFTDVWIVGGDGTLHYFLNLYPLIDLPLVIFRGGSGNDFHWLLYGDLLFGELISYVLKATPQKVDAGICNGKLFINGVGIGFDGAVAQSLSGKNKKLGKSSFLWMVLRKIFGYRETTYRLESEGISQTSPYLMINLMNGRRSGGGFHVAPEASVNDGLLELILVKPLPWWKRLRYLPLIEKGKHLSLPVIEYRKVSAVKVESDQPMPAHTDGEYLSSQSFDIRVLPGRFLFRF